jgi:putative ABC transport system permease protein
VPVRVVGICAKQGSFLGRDRDDVIFVPLTTARSRLPKEGRVTTAQIDFVHVKVASGASRAAAKEAILALLRERKHVSGGPRNMFEVFDPTQFVQLMNTTRSTLSALLAATAAISLLVGGVGIMNIMLVSVTERTREIGLRMALGARRRDILVQFVVEAQLLCVAAGIVGLVIGIVGSVLVARASGWPLIVPFWLVVAAVSAAVTIGVIFGYVPAHRAAALEPVEALRRE